MFTLTQISFAILPNEHYFLWTYLTSMFLVFLHIMTLLNLTLRFDGNWSVTVLI